MKNYKEETDTAKLVQSGMDYKSKIGYFTRSDLHWSFYNSEQWRGIDAKDLPKVQLNIVKQDINHKIASIMSQNISIKYSLENLNEIEPNEGATNYTDMLTSHVKVLFKKLKMNRNIRKALLKSAVTGDMVFFTYWDASKETNQPEKGGLNTIVIDGGNVFFADANTIDTEAQPWIIISGRSPVKQLRKEAKDNGLSDDEVQSITGDQDNEYQTGKYGKIEMDYGSDEGKATYYIKMWKENGYVKWCKETKYCTIRKEADLRIKRYPVNFANWETIENSMHGMDECRGMIPNQIVINQLHAMIAYWMRMNAFGKVAYDATRISGWSSAIGTAIPINGEITGAIQQLQAGNFNQAIVGYAEMLMQTTKSILGVGDAALGQVDPRNTSAIAVAVKQSAIPLENVQANLYQLVEDWAMTVGEFIGAYYNKRQIPVEIEGKRGMVDYQKSAGDMMLDVTIDVGPSSYYSELAGMATLDNLLSMGKITDEQYFERMKSFNIIPDIDGILKDLKAIKEQAEQMANARKSQEMMMQSMSPEQQAQFAQLPPEQQQQLINEYMAQQPV